MKINELTFDNINFNKHTERGMGLLEKSLQRNGAGRSILIDKNNRIIAGNGVIEAAGQIGLEDVQVVESDGRKIIAVKRTDIDLDSAQGREMALADNAVAAADLEWNIEALQQVADELQLDASLYGVDIELPAPRPGWNADGGPEACCDMVENVGIYSRGELLFVSFFKSTDEGYPLSEIKARPGNVEVFAAYACTVLRKALQLHAAGDWAIVTTPARRHKEGNFAEAVCASIAAELGLHFYPGAMSAKNRHRINPEFKLAAEITEHNVVLFDDILTTGATLRAARALLSDKNIFCLIGINNG